MNIFGESTVSLPCPKSRKAFHGSMHFFNYFVVVLVLFSLGLFGQELHQDHKKHTLVKSEPVPENPPPLGFGKIDHVIEIETLRGRMRYDQERFSVGPGSKAPQPSAMQAFDRKRGYGGVEEGMGLGWRCHRQALRTGTPGYSFPYDSRSPS